MKAADFRADLARYEQLRLAIGEEDLADEVEGAITPAEARTRSEAARRVLEAFPRLTLTPSPLPKRERGQEEDEESSRPVDPKIDGVCWLEEYLKLTGQGWPWRIAAWIAWASSPKVGRWPGTQMELATEVLGLTSDRTIIAARKKNPAIDEMVGVMQAAPLMEHIRDINEALAASAQLVGRNGNPDRKLAYEMLHLYQPRMKIETGKALPEKYEDLSAEELAELQAGLEGRIAELSGEEALTLPSPTPAERARVEEEEEDDGEAGE